MFPGEDVGAGGSADAVGAEGMVEAHAFLGDAVDAGGGGDFIEESAGVARDGIGGVVVRKEEEDVGSFVGGELADAEKEGNESAKEHDGDRLALKPYSAKEEYEGWRCLRWSFS